MPSVMANVSSYPAGAAAGYCFLLVSSLSCRRSRRKLFPTRFLFLYPAGAAAGSCFLIVSSSASFFLLSFWQHVFFTYFPTSDFDQTWWKWPVPWPLLRLRQWWAQRSRWGHWGQKGHFHQKGIKSYRILSIDAWLMHMHKLDPLYKSYGPKNSSGSFRVIGVKRSFSPKRRQVLQNTYHWRVTYAHL